MIKPVKSKPKEKRFEYYQSPEYKYTPADLNRSNMSISSVFIAPSKAAKQNMDRLVKIKEKVLNIGGDMSHDVDFSSMTHYSRSMTNGDGVMKDSMATLSMDQGEDDIRDFHNASMDISKEIQYNGSEKLLRNYNDQPEMNNQQKRKTEYQDAAEEVYDPKLAESLSTTKPGVQNMVISEHLQNVIDQKKNVEDYQNYINSNNLAKEPDMNDPDKNMINLENILIIDKKLGEISQSINTMVGIQALCEDWWEITQEETMLMNLGGVFKEEKYKQILKRATL